jgi:hypothetical protein
MKEAILFFGALLVANVPAQQPDELAPKGVIYGTVVDQDGQPAKGISLRADCGKGPESGMVPRTKTDQNGKYRFVSLLRLGLCTVYADDTEAGYSIYSTPPTGSGRPAEVMLSPQQLKGELNFRLPPKAGFLYIHLTDRRTGAVIPGVDVKWVLKQDPNRLIFSGSSPSDRVILIPPNEDLLLHVTSWGFLEWNESAGRRKLIRMASGSVLELDVQLEPAN